MSLELLIKNALAEDLPNGDLTTDSLDIAQRKGEAHLIAKQDVVLSGIQAFNETFKQLDRNVQLQWVFNEGDLILNRQIACVLSGNLVTMLKAERTALNFLGHLSGIASLTRSFVEKTGGTKCKILDTRKTLPGYRQLEKQAVRHGGGMNHRMNLSSAVLIKDNHIEMMGTVNLAIEKVRQKTTEPIEVEAANLEDVKQSVKLGVERILLDNMDNETIAKALQLIPPHIKTEASGNMSIARIASVAALGVDFISVGALTHSAPCADFSLRFQWAEA